MRKLMYPVENHAWGPGWVTRWRYARYRTDDAGPYRQNSVMANAVNPGLVTAERVDTGLVIKFADGRCAFYSAAVLYAALSQAKALDEDKVVW